MGEASEINKPGLLRAIEVVKNFEEQFRLTHKSRKRFDLHAVQVIVDEGIHLIIEDLEAEAGLRAPWKPEPALTPACAASDADASATPMNEVHHDGR